MPPRPRRAPVRSMGRSRRRVIWATQELIYSATANNQWATFDLLTDFKGSTGSQITKATVLRTHLSIVPAAAPATADRWWVGLKVYELDDITTTPTTNAFVPNPRDNHYVDWAFMAKLVHDSNGNLHVGGSAGLPNGAGLDLDLRSKRRLNNIQETWGLCLYQDTVGTVAKTYHIFARSLLALA